MWIGHPQRHNARGSQGLPNFLLVEHCLCPGVIRQGSPKHFIWVVLTRLHTRRIANRFAGYNQFTCPLRSYLERCEAPNPTLNNSTSTVPYDNSSARRPLCAVPVAACVRGALLPRCSPFRPGVVRSVIRSVRGDARSGSYCQAAFVW